MINSISTVSAAEFATAYALRPNLVSWFLGAGASAASGIPTGYAMIRDFKSQIFCRENKLSRREIDTGDQVWIDRIDEFFRLTSLLPPDGDPAEYAAAFEALYPNPKHRRQYIDDAIAKGTPCFGHRVLGSLIAGRRVDCVFTTNFDPLIEEAVVSANTLLATTDKVRPVVAAIDSADRALRCLNEADWPLIAKLHGDYQSTSIKNTGTELERQDERMRHVLVEASKRYGMVFVGYSGRDASVMDTLTSVLTEKSPFPNGIYWVISAAGRLLPMVQAFLEKAAEAGVDVTLVECKTFDELAGEVVKQVDLPAPLLDHVLNSRPTSRLVPVSLPTIEARKFPVLRYSAILIEALPIVARRITLSCPSTTAAVRALLKEERCRAIVSVSGREVRAFGRDSEIILALSSLGAKVSGTVTLDAVRDSWALGLLYDAFVNALARRRPLIPRLSKSGHSLVVATPREGEGEQRSAKRVRELLQLSSAYGTALSGGVPTLGFPYREGVNLKLEQIEGRWWCGFEPFTFIDIPRREIAEQHLQSASAWRGHEYRRDASEHIGGDPAGDWRRERWAQRYNKHWAQIIDAWAVILTSSSDGTIRSFGLDDTLGIDAVFAISRVTGWSRPAHHHPYLDRNK